MDIIALSTALSQNSVQQTASVQVQKLAMNSAETQGAALAKMMGETITDPSLGNLVNVLA
jgi:Putative motility protein